MILFQCRKRILWQILRHQKKECRADCYETLMKDSEKFLTIRRRFGGSHLSALTPRTKASVPGG